MDGIWYICQENGIAKYYWVPKGKKIYLNTKY